MDFIYELVTGMWKVVAEMSPYLLFGFVVAGFLSVLISPQFVETHLGKGGIKEAIKASLFGVPMPLCSCSVVPVSVSLRRHGASKGATASFMTSTPQTGVDSIMVTASLLGWAFTVFRVLIAFLSGVICGVFVELGTKETVEKKEEAKRELEPEGFLFVRAFYYGLITLPGDIAKSLLVGILISAFMGAVMPEDFFVEYLGEGLVPMLVMLVVGIPLYVCSTASVPIALTFMLKGLSPGAALVFLVTGPATNMATVTTMKKVLGGRAMVVYLLTLVFSALGAGILLDSLAFSPQITEFAEQCHASETAWWEHLSGVILLQIFIFAWLHQKKHGKKSCCGDKGDSSSCCSSNSVKAESTCCDSVEKCDPVGCGCAPVVEQRESCCSGNEQKESGCCSTNNSNEKSGCCQDKGSSEKTACGSGNGDKPKGGCCGAHK